ncbi:MAG: T9SS type A sorting domain-containing protein, partial [Chitinophagales bacterium]
LWNVGDLASGEGATLTLGVLVGDFSGTLAYFAQIQTSDSNDPDSTLGNDTDQTPNEDDEASISYIYIPPLSADLELSILHFDITVVPTAAEYDLIVEIKNNGPETATGIVVSSILPNNIFSLSDPSVSQGTYDNDDWIVGDLASGESAGLSFYGFIDEFDTPNFYFAQIQTASPNDLDSTPGNDTNQTADEDDEVWVDFTVLAAADLHLSILDGGGTVNEGEVHTLKLRVSNAGPQEATGVSIADILPNELTIQGVTATQGSYDNGLWNVGDLDFYEDAFLDIEVLVGDFSGTFEYFAQIQTSDQYDPNSTPGDNTTGIPNEGDEAKIDFIPESTPQADLSLTAAFDVANAELGDGVKITLKITNDGPATATNIIVSDVTPNALLIIAPTVSKGTYDGDWSIGELASGESATIVFNGIVEIFENPIIYFAQVKSVDQDDPDSTPNSDTAQLPLEDDEALAVLTVIPPFQSADLSLTVPSGGVLNIGDVHTFSVNVFNDGPDVATNVTIADILPSAFILQNSTPTQGDYTAGLWNVGDLASGEGATLKLEVLVGDFTGTLTYFAQVQTSDSNDPNSIPGNDTDQTPNEDDEATISYIYIPTGTDIDLELNISSNVGEFNLYENVTYTIEVTNNGPANASGVQVATAVPAGMAFTSKTASKGSYNLWAGVWTVGDLANGETATLEVVTFTLNNSASITNFAQVKAAQQDDSDSTPNSNNTGVPVEDDEDSVTIIPAGSTNNMIDLALSKTANVSTAKAGDAITYTLVIVNNGTEMATGVTVEDLLPSNLTFTGSTASKGSYDETTGIWNVTMLPIGGSATLNIHTTVDAIALPMTNFAQVKTANEEDVDSTPDSNAGTTPNEDDEDSVTILPDNSSEFCDIELTTEFSSSGQPGSSGTLYLNIVNNGPADATDVSVVYDIPNEHFSSTYEVVSKGNLVSGGWDVGDLASGDGAVVIFEGIVQLSTESSVFFAQVETASPQDSDSTPGNDTDQTPDEDDEAKLTFSPSGSTNIDLEANMTSSQANLSLYSNITFTLEVTNNSSIAASGVLAEFPIPSGLAFTSKTVSHGNYNLWSKVWTIGDLQPYETATLNLTLFVLNQSNNKILYAEVIGANESDVDSTPNNGIYQVVAEDDEAAVTVLANSGGGGKNDLSTNIIGKSRLLTVHRMFPVPTQNTVNLIFSSEAETIDINLYDYTGRLLHRQTLEVLPDVNTTQLDLTDFPAGVYYISMETEEGNVRTKVVKQ